MAARGPLGMFRYGDVSYSPLNVWQPVEAAPIYSSISVRLRITGGPNNGYDETASWTRIPISTSGSPINAGDGIDSYDFTAPTGTDCVMLAGDALLVAGESSVSIRDPKKQRLAIFGQQQIISGVAIPLPNWQFDGADARLPARWWYIAGSSGASGIDSDTFSPAQWRDLRGSYAFTLVASPETFQFDWTIA